MKNDHQTQSSTERSLEELPSVKSSLHFSHDPSVLVPAASREYHRSSSLPLSRVPPTPPCSTPSPPQTPVIPLSFFILSPQTTIPLPVPHAHTSPFFSGVPPSPHSTVSSCRFTIQCNSRPSLLPLDLPFYYKSSRALIIIHHVFIALYTY